MHVESNAVELLWAGDGEAGIAQLYPTAHASEDVADGVAWLGGVGGPVCDSDVAPGDGGCCQEGGGVGEVGFNCPVVGVECSGGN